MGYKHKQTGFNKTVILVLFIFILLLYVYHQWRTSVILAEQDRINIAVFSQMPFVYSFNVRQNFAVVTYFHPDYLIKVPGGYDWYRVGSLNLLGKIEKQRAILLKSAFSELLGAPIDFVYYPKKAQVVDKSQSIFNKFYHNFIKGQLFGSKYQNSLNNLFDRLLIRNLFKVRADHLVFLDTTDLVVKEQGRSYYYSDKLDTRLKGMFYHESLINQAYKAVVITDKTRYSQAQLILRQLEGVGIKVIDIEVISKPNSKQCVIKASKSQQLAAEKLTRLFGCKKSQHKSKIINFIL